MKALRIWYGRQLFIAKKEKLFPKRIDVSFTHVANEVSRHSDVNAHPWCARRRSVELIALHTDIRFVFHLLF